MVSFFFWPHLYVLFFSASDRPVILKQPVAETIYTATDTGFENKPILLIELDGYSSPVALEKYFPQDDTYAFSKHLVSKSWQVKNNFYSLETSTFHSIGSLMNFNLSVSGLYKNASELIASENLVKAKLIDSLEAKNIKIDNLGFFHLGRNKPGAYITPYPTGFFELLSIYSYITVIKLNTNNFQLDGIFGSIDPISKYNSDLLNKLPAFYRNDTSSKRFIYFHLWMPHNPISFTNEINLKDYTRANYYQYWMFTNKKITRLLDSLNYQDKCRIIITGDHGYRYDKQIDPKSTFSAFYGFDSTSVNKLNSVQDFGKLINAYFSRH